MLTYLDDFFFAAYLKLVCDQNIQLFINTCRLINFPISLEKTFWGTTQLTFLGLLIDTVRQLVLIPMEKIDKAKDLIRGMLIKEKGNKTTNSTVCGTLNFFAKCIIPARAFTRKLYNMVVLPNKGLREYHHVHLTWMYEWTLKCGCHF